MHENRSKEPRRSRAKLALCAFLFVTASAVYAADATDAANDRLVPDGQISAGVEVSPSDSLQVANVAAMLWRQFRVARHEGTLIAQRRDFLVGGRGNQRITMSSDLIRDR